MRRFLSLGAGVQSSTLALMAAAGEIAAPEAAIFADTQAEPQAVYDWLGWLEQQLPFPVYRVTEGSLFDVIGQPRKTGVWPIMPIPAFIQGLDGRPALANRSCTQDYKLIPIRRKVRELLGLTGRRSPDAPVATQLIGISLDEAQRMKDSREPWIRHEWPLIDLRMTRADCIAWMEARGYPRPPKSSCTFCPYHDNAQWAATKADPEAWAQAVAVDRRIRELWHGRVPSGLFLHRSLKPLEEVDFEKAERQQPNLFGNECEGMCGV